MRQIVDFSLVLAITFGSGILMAQQVDFATVPPREGVQLTIYNSDDLTLVRDIRTIGLNQGVNLLQFSWANTLIDPTSVQLQFADDTGLQILDTRFPHNKTQSLTWRVESDQPRTVQSEISYFTSGISWAAEYTAVANADETAINIESFIRITNKSGEEYENAQVRVVVGKINLLDNIAELARRGLVAPSTSPEELPRARRELTRQLMAAPMAPSMVAESVADMGMSPPEVEKAALGEYFIYTIEGQETVPNQWAKQLLSFRAEGVPLTVRYRYRVREYGDSLVKLYLLHNDIDHELGTTPLPDGMWRVFHADEQGQLRYLNAQSLPYRPIGDEVALNLGTDPLVTFAQRKLQVTRRDILLELQGVRGFVPANSPNLRVDLVRRVAGWIDEQRWVEQLGNFSQRPITLEVRRRFDGDVTFKSGLDASLHDVNTVEMRFTVPPQQRQTFEYIVSTKQGELAKQSRVELAAP